MDNGSTSKTTERLADELKTIAAEAEALIKAKGEDLAEKTKEIRDRLAGALETAQETVESLETQATQGMEAADRAIRKYPYQSLGIALGIGLVLGMIVKKR